MAVVPPDASCSPGDGQHAGDSSPFSVADWKRVLWHDANVHKFENVALQARLRENGFRLKTFTEPELAQRFLARQPLDQKWMVMTSGRNGEHLVRLIQDIECVFAISVFCADKPRHEQWAVKYPKVRRVHNCDKEVGPLMDEFTSMLRILDRARLGAYSDLQQFLEGLQFREDAPLRLVRASFIVSQWAQGQRLTRRQDIPEEAFFGEEILELCQSSSIDIVAVSYPWLDASHPDPDAFHLGILGPVLEKFVMARPGRQVALFIDFCCMFQMPRTAEQEIGFATGLKQINVLYAQQTVHVWCLTKTPTASHRSYFNRGWCLFELLVASITTDPGRLLDLGMLPEDLEDNSQQQRATMTACHAKRLPPLTPARFAEKLSETVASGDHVICFTNGVKDRPFVVDKYTRTFKEVLHCTEGLWFAHANWTDEEVIQLADVLPTCHRLKSLWLHGNSQISDVGIAALAESFPPSLEHLDVTGTSTTLSPTHLSAEDAPEGQAGAYLRENIRRSLQKQAQKKCLII
eukprot:TRINITY_DN122520_c0_g1_i1.p1 TRINITY_DN122520_c0_g1~~TRINITY_DN122520_c0_g1_i1.p1  ORF type:complete len:520 (+),score=45.25 TRINITY_DN122520_c0_g1_i1:115-1674(+)